MNHWWQIRWLGLLGLCLGWGLLSLLLFRAGVWIPIAAPLALFAATTAAVSFTDRWLENALLRQEVTRLWQTYRHDLVVRAIDLARLSAIFRAHPLTITSLQTSKIGQLSLLAEQFGRSHSAQAAIARSLSIGLVAADLDGFVWFCNPVATAQLQVHLGDALPTCLIPLWLDKDQWHACIQSLQHREPIVPQEIQQDDRWYELKIEPLTYRYSPRLVRSEQPEGLLLLLEDITNKKQIETYLRQQMQGLEELNQLKDEFLSTVSHELRSPLSNIKMITEMLQSANSEEQRNYYLQILDHECDREAELIDDLLNLQRLENDPGLPNLTEIDLQSWLPQLIEPFQERTQARQQMLQLRLSCDLPMLISDQWSLERILAELINNACKYTPPGETITIEVDARPPQTLPSHIRFVVSNSGIEIPPAQLSKIFDKFYRIPNSDRWKQGGSGLGLTLVKKLVDRLDGTIQVASQSNRTQFTVQIPQGSKSEFL
jgi:signal transduction histidine kinase